MKVVKSNVLCKVKKNDSESGYKTKAGSFVIPDSAKDYLEAEVVAVGEEVKDEVKPGDMVYIYRGAGKTIKLDDTEYQVINVSEIIVII